MNRILMSNFEAKILVVDDEAANVLLLEQILEDAGYTSIVTTSDSREVVGLHKFHAFDLILLDLRMPYLTGFQVMEALAGYLTDDWVPIIVLTAQIDDHSRSKAINAGAWAFVHKPYRQWEIDLLVRNAIQIRKLYQENTKKKEFQDPSPSTQIFVKPPAHVEILARITGYIKFSDCAQFDRLVRLARWSRELSQAVGLSQEYSEAIFLGAITHDIGKIHIPDSILSRPGPIHSDERSLVQRHCDIGANIIGATDNFAIRIARNIALAHHEKWDGTGYPTGTLGEDIPIEARIVSICAVFEAVIANRPYAKPWSIDDALSYLSDMAGREFDPTLVAAFLKLFHANVIELSQESGSIKRGSHVLKKDETQI